MGAITTTSIYDEPVVYRFDERRRVSVDMRAGIDWAFVVSPQARLAMSHDFGLDKQVRIMPREEYFITSSSGLARHLIVRTEAGGQVMLYLVDVGRHYECLVGSAWDVREFVAHTIAPDYHRHAYDIEKAQWRDSFGVAGLTTLHCSDDGAFCGGLIRGHEFTFDGSLKDTTADWMLPERKWATVAGSAALVLPDLATEAFVDAVSRIEEAQAA